MAVNENRQSFEKIHPEKNDPGEPPEYGKVNRLLGYLFGNIPSPKKVYNDHVKANKLYKILFED